MPQFNLGSTLGLSTAVTDPVLLGGPIVDPQCESADAMMFELETQLGNRSDLATRSLRWINQAYLELATMVSIPALDVKFGFDTGDPTILLPAVLKFVRSAAILDPTYSGFSTNKTVNDRKLEFISVDTFRRLPLVDGRADRYTFENKLFALYPAPDITESVAIDGYILPNKLASGPNTSMYGPEWDEAIMLLARSKAHNALEEWDDGAQAYNVALSHIRSKRDFKSEQRGDEIAAFRPNRRRLTQANFFNTRKGDY